MMRVHFQPERYARLFYLAALWNIAAAAVALIAPEYHAQTFYGSTASALDPVSAIDTQIFWVSVLFFGLGYWLVARDPRKNHGLVLIAAAGKTVVGIRWIMAYMAGVAQPFALIGAIGDLVFAGCFAYFLYGASRSKSLLPSV